MVIRRGEIWWADLPEPVGSGPGDRRPVLIVQSDPFNRSAIGTVIVAPMTSKLRLAAAPGNVLVAPAESGLKVESVVNVSQLITIDKDLLSERSGRLKSGRLVKVFDGIKLVLGI